MKWQIDFIPCTNFKPLERYIKKLSKIMFCRGRKECCDSLFISFMCMAESKMVRLPFVLEDGEKKGQKANWRVLFTPILISLHQLVLKGEVCEWLTSEISEKWRELTSPSNLLCIRHVDDDKAMKWMRPNSPRQTEKKKGT